MFLLAALWIATCRTVYVLADRWFTGAHLLLLTTFSGMVVLAVQWFEMPVFALLLFLPPVLAGLWASWTASALVWAAMAALLADMNVILRNSQHLSRLVDDVLDLSQIETGRMALSKEWASIWNELMAGAILAASVPVLLVFPFQRYYVRSIASTGIK